MDELKDIFKAWDSRAEMARDLSVEPFVVQAWWRRQNIPGQYWCMIAEAAQARGKGRVTVEAIARLHDRRTRDAAA